MINVPDPQTVLRELSLLLPVVYSALHHGIFKTKEFFDQQQKEEQKIVNRFLAPNLVRYYTIQALEQKGQVVASDTDSLDLKTVPNNGICFSYEKYDIRILKSYNGDLPVPGHSKSRQEFYHQLSLNLNVNDKDEDAGRVNLLILWEVNPLYNLEILSMACPKAGGETKESVIAHWHCKIPEEILFGNLIPESNLKNVEVEDLPISLNVSAELAEDAI